MVANKKDIIADLKSSAKTADQIILATDPDREGEAIASHIADMLSSKSNIKDQKSAKSLKLIIFMFLFWL